MPQGSILLTSWERIQLAASARSTRRTVAATLSRALVQRADLDRSTPGGTSGRDVPPPVAHHETSLAVDVESLHCLEEHPRLRLTALAVVDVVVRAHQHRVDSELTLDHCVHGVHDGGGLRPSSDVGLIGHDHEHVARALQLVDGVSHSWQEFELVQRVRRTRDAISVHRPIEYAVTVEEHRRRDARSSQRDVPVPEVHQHRVQRRRQRLTSVHHVRPSEAADAVGVESHYRNVAAPPAIAARVVNLVFDPTNPRWPRSPTARSRSP